MEPAALKLAAQLGDVALATRLVESGFTCPTSIRVANNRTLQREAGLTTKELETVRQVWPRSASRG